MLNISIWFFVQVANFLVLLIVLNYILFKPLLRLFNERQDKIKGAIENAKAIENKKEENLIRLNKDIAEAREKAKAIFDEFRAEGLKQQRAGIVS